MAKKKKALNYREAWDEILAEMPWQQRQKILQAGEKYRKPADLAEVERLYYRVIGLSEDEIKRRMGMNHVLKTWPEFYEQLGAKKIEIRKADRDFKVGDTVTLREFVPEGKVLKIVSANKTIDGPNYTGRETMATITHIQVLHEVPGVFRDLNMKEEEYYVALSLNFHDAKFDSQVQEFRELAGLSDQVRTMAVMMETLLASHATKGSADDIKLTGGQCMENLRQQVHELDQAMIDFALGKVGHDVVLIKSANVNNYSMFCAQVCGALKAKG